MTGIDHLTRELADMPSGVAYAAHAHAHYRKNPDFPISGDAIAHMRAEQRDIGGADCD